MNKNIYIGIFLIGLVFSVLTLASGYGMNSAITVLFLTVAFLLFIKLLIELRYYRSYKAPLASGIFLLIPSIIALGASYVSRNPAINDKPLLADMLVNINLKLAILFSQPIFLFANVFSLVLALPFYIFLLILLYRYYYGIYPRLFLMRKKFYKQFAMYFNIILMGIIVFEWLSTNTIEIFELCFVIISIALIIRTYVFKIVLVPVRAVPGRPRRNAQRRSYTSPTNTSPNRSTLSHPTNNPRTTNPQRNPRLTQVPNRTLSQPRPTPRPVVRHNQSSGHVQVAEGIPVTQTVKQRTNKKISKDKVLDLIPPTTHLSEDDFRCIFCYELPTKSSDQVIICPNCKKPAHFPEYQKWTALSNICSYCNQDVGSRIPKRINGKIYQQIINVALRG